MCFGDLYPHHIGPALLLHKCTYLIERVGGFGKVGISSKVQEMKWIAAEEIGRVCQGELKRGNDPDTNKIF